MSIMFGGLQIILTAFATVAVFVLGQLLQRLFIEPIQEQRRLIGRVCHACIYYRGMVLDVKGKKPSDADIAAARSNLRGLAADLRATLSVLPLYKVLRIFRLVFPREKVEVVSLQLERWALFMSQSAMQSSVEQIRDVLKMEIEDEFTEFEKSMTSPEADGES